MYMTFNNKVTIKKKKPRRQLEMFECSILTEYPQHLHLTHRILKKVPGLDLIMSLAALLCSVRRQRAL